MPNAATEIASIIDNAYLELNYQCKTPQVSYSIADYVGNIVLRGSYDCIINNKLDVQELARGVYMLCIIDGDSLIKTRFMKN